MTSTRVKHPILRLDVLAADGTTTSDHRVFCRYQRESVGVEECCACVHCDSITDGPTPFVECEIPLRPLDHTEDPAGESVEVAALLRRGSIVLSESAALSRALGMLREEGRRSVAIVDEKGVLVGVVHESSFLRGAGPGGIAPVGATMSAAIALHERTPVRVALRLLAASHLREATIVSKDGVPIGVFRDVDGLRWIAGTGESADKE